VQPLFKQRLAMLLNRRFALLPLLFAPLLCSLALTATPAHAALTGSGKSATETRTVGEFQAIALTGAMDLVARQGAQQQVQIQADDNLLPLLETVVENTRHGATLVVRFKKGESFYGRSRVQVTVTVPKLTAVTSNGSGDLRVEAFTTPSLHIGLAGSGDAKIEGLAADELSVRISGSGNVTGKGSTRKLDVNIAGSGEVSLMDLRSADAVVSIAGSGDARLNAQKTLNVRIAGSGDVTYTGNATLNSKVAGSGSVSKK
jgi:carbon monoxide dehydrogenase subunit G